MNPERAYERHTDLARAWKRPGDGARVWLEQRVDYMAGDYGLRQNGMVTVSDPLLVQRKYVEQGPLGTTRASVVLGYAPDEDSASASDDQVGVIDPGLLADPLPLEEAGNVPEALMFPTGIFADVTTNQLARSTTFYVTADMCQLLDHAAKSMDETDFMPDYPRYRSGVAVLARPIELPYGDGTTQIVDAFAWNDYGTIVNSFGTVGHAGVVWQFTDRTRHPADVMLDRARECFASETAWRNSPELVPVVADRYTSGSPIGKPLDDIGKIMRNRHEYLAAMRTLLPDEPIRDWTDPVEPVGRFQPYLAAFLLLLSQQITAPRAETMHISVVKRGHKVSMKRSSSVTVVDLRRRANGTATGSDTGRHLENRHPVDGHWKWQVYGPERKLRKRIFVSDYIRGPEDAPLVVKPKVVQI